MSAGDWAQAKAQKCVNYGLIYALAIQVDEGHKDFYFMKTAIRRGSLEPFDSSFGLLKASAAERAGDYGD